MRVRSVAAAGECGVEQEIGIVGAGPWSDPLTARTAVRQQSAKEKEAAAARAKEKEVAAQRKREQVQERAQVSSPSAFGGGLSARSFGVLIPWSLGPLLGESGGLLVC